MEHNSNRTFSYPARGTSCFSSRGTT